MSIEQESNTAGSFGAASPELRELVRAVCDESLTSAQRDRLEELLRDDAGARVFYLAHVDMTARIQFLYRGRSEAGVNLATGSQAGARKPLLSGLTGFGLWTAHRSLTAALILVGIVAVGSFLAIRKWRGEAGPVAPVIAEKSPYVATLGRAVGVVWEGAAPDPAKPVFVTGSELRMKKGLAELTFQCGVHMVVEGPAVLSFETDDTVLLSSGKVRAEVPNEAIGFVVRTQRAKIVDRGTAFGASVDPQGHTQVQVFRGKVDTEVLGDSGQSTRFFQLSEGESLNVGVAREAVVAQSINPDAFPRLPPLSPAERWDHWRGYRGSLLRDPDLVGYWSFDDGDARDLSVYGNEGYPMNSPAYSAQVPAALGGGRCLDVSAGPKFIQVPHSASLDVDYCLTIAFWLRGPNQQQDWARVLSKGGMMNCSGWVIHRGGDENQIRTVVGNSAHCNQSTAGVDGVYDNSWHHLAVVLNRGAWQVYLDGQYYSRGVYHHNEGLASTAELVIGAAGQDQMMFGSLDFEGQIDELCIFRRPLSAAEIRRLCPATEPKLQDRFAHK